ncbi:MAG TPA: isocitrate lyase/phosphoenolpyruvate mutase family protein, partial [Oleiagrimonas sp.]|nr:isocitrate lyase/phosphoenolpyruvate mutase family protein [Oleiagrimonas sp.]
SEGFLIGLPDMDETLRRLTAYAEAGADCLYAPGLSTADQIKAVVEAVAPKPVNVLLGPASSLTLADMAALGVRRISVGGALALAAWNGFNHAIDSLVEERADGFTQMVTHAELNRRFANDT